MFLFCGLLKKILNSVKKVINSAFMVSVISWSRVIFASSKNQIVMNIEIMKLIGSGQSGNIKELQCMAKTHIATVNTPIKL